MSKRDDAARDLALEIVRTERMRRAECIKWKGRLYIGSMCEGAHEGGSGKLVPPFPMPACDADGLTWNEVLEKVIAWRQKQRRLNAGAWYQAAAYAAAEGCDVREPAAQLVAWIEEGRP